MVNRILFVDHADGLGGAEHSLLLLMSHLDKTKWEPHLACVNGRLAQAAQALHISTHIISVPRLRRSRHFLNNWIAGIKTIRNLAKSIDANILYANTIRATIYTCPAATTIRHPFIWHMRDFWLSESKPKRTWLDTAVKKIICTQSTQIIANSSAVAAHLPCPDKVNVVPNGIEIPKFNPHMDGSLFRSKYHIPTEAPLVGMVGRLRPWKGQATFLQMAAQLKQTWPYCHFVIVGGSTFDMNDGYPQQLEQLTQTLALRNRVTFTGALDDVRPALAAMNIFVHPGEPEPFGLVNVEAMAMAKPVVAFNHGALPEIVIDGETGLLVEAGNVAALAQAISSLLENPAKSEQMGQHGRRRVETHFTIQNTAQAIDSIIDGSMIKIK